MKKKFLINLLTIPLGLIVFFVFIQPQSSQMLESREKLEKFQEKMDSLNQKIQNVDNLSQELTQNPENQKMVMDYVPEQRGDDFIVSYLDNITFGEGVPISNVVIQEKKDKTSQAQPGQGGSAMGVSPQPVFLTTQFSVLSSYEKIMAIAKKFDSLKRSNTPISLKIVKTYPEDKKEDATVNSLQADFSLDFNYLKKISSRAEIGEELLAKEGFDPETLKRIKEKATEKAREPEVQSSGRPNPFIP